MTENMIQSEEGPSPRLLRQVSANRHRPQPSAGHLTRLMLLSAIVGVVCGLGAILFYYLIDFSTQMFLVRTGAFVPPVIDELTGEVSRVVPELTRTTFGLHGLPWYLPLIPAIGGLITGLIVYTWAPEAEGHGTDAAIDAFHNKKGRIRPRVPLIKTITSAITIGSGGSAGREGPIAQIGAGFASFLSSRLKLSDQDRRVLMVAGMGGGIGSIFRAPLGGALFAASVLYRDEEFEYEAIIPSIISSIVGYSVFSSLVGWGQLFVTPEFTFRNPAELLFYVVLAAVCAGLGWVYVKVFYGMRTLFSRLPLPPHVRPAIGGLLLGLLAMMFPQVLGSGYGWVQLAIYGKMAVGLMLMVALAKILATSLTISSGGSGGVFAPSLVIGAMLGGAVGGILNTLVPGIVTQPGAYVIVGMAGFFAAVAHTPIATLIMVCELSGNYGLLPPLMLVCVCAMLFARKFSIYERQVPARIDSPAHRGDFIMDVLEGLTVKDAVALPNTAALVREDTPLKDIVQLITYSRSSYFPVVDSEGLMTGIFDIHDVRRILTDEHLASLVIARDLAHEKVITVQPDDDLREALGKFATKNLEELPVVDPDNPRQVVGMITRRHLISAYNRQMTQTDSGE